MANDVPSGIPLSFEHFCVLAQLEPAEIAQLAAVSGSGERPLRGWIQTLADDLGLRLPRQPLPAPGPTPIPGTGEPGVGILAAGLDDRGHLLITLSNGTVVDAGLVRSTGLNTPEGSVLLTKNADGYYQLIPQEETP